MRSQRRQGIAVVTALILLVLVSGLAVIMTARILDEIRNSSDDAAIVQTLMLARGAANLAGAVLTGPVRDDLQLIVASSSSTVSAWSFGDSQPNDDRPSPSSVVDALATDSDSVAEQLQTAIDNVVCDATVPDVGVTSTISVRVHVTDDACGEALPGSLRLPAPRFVQGSPRGGSGFAPDQEYSMPYVIVAEGVQGAYRRSLVVQGEYRFTVGRGSFAQYALFTNVHRTTNFTNVWFTDRTLFDGPVHSNEILRFYRNPWFGGQVTSAGCVRASDEGCASVAGADQADGAIFYGAPNNGFVSASDMGASPDTFSIETAYGTMAPEFADGVDYGAKFVELPENVLDQRAAAQDEGLFFRDDLYSLEVYAGDDDGAVVADGDATYQYVEATDCDRGWRCDEGDTTRYRFGTENVLEVERCNRRDCWWEIEGPFNGVLYVDGDVDRLTGPERDPATSDDANDARPALASFAQMTLVTAGDARITGDLVYEDPPCSSSPSRTADGTVISADCSNLSADNILGVYAGGGDVLIGNNHSYWNRDLNAPYDVVVHGVLMSANGVVTVEDYAWGSPRGTVNLLGGIIEDYYGAFGTFSASSGQNVSGYGRSIAFDRRTEAGLAPPYFPTIGTDGVKSVRVFSYGQSEQVY